MNMVLLHRWLLPIATGVLLALAYPPFNVSQLAWLALVPLLFAAERCDRGEAFRRGYIAGLVFFAATVWWTIHVTLPGMVALAAFLALYFGAAAWWSAFCGSLGPSPEPSRRELEERPGEGKSQQPWAPTDSVGRNLLIAVLGTAGWVTLEWVRGRFLFGGFGWNGLGVSQHSVVPLIQFVSVTGVYGVSALVCFVNFALFFTARRFVRKLHRPELLRQPSWEFYIAMILVCGTFVQGLRGIHHVESPRTLRLALVQGDIPQSLKFDPGEKPMILERYERLTRLAMAGKPDLIIWPETATPGPMRYDVDSFALVTNLAGKADACLLTGTIDATPHSSPPELFNGAILVCPEGRIAGIYHKIHLVPFGEYVPLRRLAVPFLKWLGPKGYEVSDDYGFENGKEFTVFEVGGVRFGTVICFEDTMPDLYRHFVQRGVDFMVNVTNDAWFKTSPAAEMHLANAVFRAAETRRPLVRCTNNGVTCVVDEFGFVNPRTRLAPFTDETLVCELSLPHLSGTTFYTRHGDWFVGVWAAVTGVVLLGYAARRRLKPAATAK
jgi:apolipoprotein N-acyltransferase